MEIREGVRIVGLEVPPEIPRGGLFTARLTWKNTGSIAYSFDVVTAFGPQDEVDGVKYMPGTIFAPFLQDVLAEPGEIVVSELPCRVPEDEPLGIHACIPAICDILRIEDSMPYTDWEHLYAHVPGFGVYDLFNVVEKVAEAPIGEIAVVAFSAV